MCISFVGGGKRVKIQTDFKIHNNLKNGVQMFSVLCGVAKSVEVSVFV